MKKTILILLVILLLAAVPVIKLMRLEVINKSAEPAYLKLQEVTWDTVNPYYLQIPAGASLPAVRLYTLVRGVYDVDAQYCDQEWTTIFVNLDLFRAQFRITIPACDQMPVVDAVPDLVLKLNPWLYPPVDVYDVPIIHDLGGFNWRY
jgi:hypothetical protein